MNDLVIETTGLQKVYGRKVAVADLTLQVPKGEVFGFLGPNGAGKSTSVKMLLGLVAPSSGCARVLGQAPGDPAAMVRVGFLPEHFRFHEWMRAAELLDLHGRLYGMPPEARRKRIPDVLEMVGLAEHMRRPLTDFSKGMLQRIGLAQALLHDPELVFLDEPTSALDPFGRMLVRRLLHDLKAQGTTVFLNSHLLGEVEATCDRVSFIKEGRVLRTVALDDLRAGHLHVELRVDVATPALLEALRSIDGAGLALRDPAAAGDGLLHLTLVDEQLLPVVAERVLESGARLYALTPQRITLEQLFLEVVGREDSGQ
jgi:ABC-2 type transport system ATP-binding protein